jgi:hypothetical protein
VDLFTFDPYNVLPRPILVDLVKLDPNFVPSGPIFVDMVKLHLNFVPDRSENRSEINPKNNLITDMFQVVPE